MKGYGCMSFFRKDRGDQEINKVLKMNLDQSNNLLYDSELSQSRHTADEAIESSKTLLASLGWNNTIETLSNNISQNHYSMQTQPQAKSWEELVAEAASTYTDTVSLPDILTKCEINQALAERKKIEKLFSQKTGITNKTDLAFLAIATALQVAKALITPYVAGKLGYGNKIDTSTRLPHNDKSIQKAHRQANDRFKTDHIQKHGTGYWLNILYQTPPYDITKGSSKLGINMGGGYHRMYTLGHDPVLGWIFGTMNILTDTVTLNDFKTLRVVRKSSMQIVPGLVPMSTLLQESIDTVKADYLNLPAAIYAQWQHLKSDEFTKLGLPVPLLSSFNENFASAIYKSNYDALCLERDIKIIGVSFVVSRLIDMIIGLIHGLFRKDSEPMDLYEVRTRKILLISNSIASSSSLIYAGITSNPKNLDIGGLLSSISRLFCDLPFMIRIKKEFISKELDKKLQTELDKLDKLYGTTL